MDNAVIRNGLGLAYENNFLFLPADGTKGGIIIAFVSDHLSLSNPHFTANTISAKVTDNRTNIQWTTTSVYGPQLQLDKKLFIRELKALKSTASTAWLILGDFNLIYKDEDKNSDRLNRNMMNRFRRALNHLQVKELSLVGRKFTWSNGQENRTMTHIDRVFSTTEFEQIYREPVIYAQSSYVSDHSPLLVLPLPKQQSKPLFRFEAHWVHMPGFENCVQQAWQQPTNHSHNPLLNLHIKLSRAAKGLQKWSKSLIPQAK